MCDLFTLIYFIFLKNLSQMVVYTHIYIIFFFFLTLPIFGRKRESTSYQFAYRVVAIMLTLTFVIATQNKNFQL